MCVCAWIYASSTGAYGGQGPWMPWTWGHRQLWTALVESGKCSLLLRQLLCHALFLQRSSNDHLATFPLLPLLLQSLSAYCLKYEINQCFLRLRLMKIQSTVKQNPTTKELSMKLGFKIHMCVYIVSIAFCIYHITYGSIEKKRQPHCAMKSYGQKLFRQCMTWTSKEMDIAVEIIKGFGINTAG